ncbi:MAG: acyl carrier protein [Chitinivibrionales bacterium]|nr:acyl carrier protein [Chitinivibrionales bacterium]
MGDQISRENIVSRIKKVVVEVLRVEENKLSESSNFQEDLGADSLDIVTMLMSLEDEFKRQISDEEAKSLITIGATADFIMNQIDSPSSKQPQS